MPEEEQVNDDELSEGEGLRIIPPPPSPGMSPEEYRNMIARNLERANKEFRLEKAAFEEDGWQMVRLDLFVGPPYTDPPGEGIADGTQMTMVRTYHNLEHWTNLYQKKGDVAPPSGIEWHKRYVVEASRGSWKILKNERGPTFKRGGAYVV